MDSQTLTSIATITIACAAVISILREELLLWFRHPEFLINFINGQPDCHRVPLNWCYLNSLGTAQTHYIRCRVKNNGKIAAKDVEVAIIEVKRKDATGRFQTQKMALPLNLLWSHYKSHILPQLPLGAERHFTLGHIVDPEQRTKIPNENDPNREIGNDRTFFCLETFVKSNTLEYLIEPGEYKIFIQVSAANAKPKNFTFHLNHTGVWFENEEKMYSEALGMRIE